MFAYVTGGNPTHLAPGEAKRIEVNIYTPCADDTPFEIPGVCGRRCLTGAVRIIRDDTPFEIPGVCGIWGARRGFSNVTDWSGPDDHVIKTA